jgi:uncharacterized protein
MSISVSYPGVYIYEAPSTVHTITGVATSIGAFVDAFLSGPLNKAVQILSFADFENQFGGLAPGSEASYAIQQFFLNGGSEAYVVRVTSAPATGSTPAVAAAIGLQDQVAGSLVLTATSSGPGAWGNSLRLDVDYGTTNPTTQFNLTVTEVSVTGTTTAVVAKEIYRNLVIDPSQNNDAAATVNAASQLITLASATCSTGKRPAQTGTASKAITNFTGLGISKGDTLDVSLGTTKIGTIAGLPAVPADLGSFASALQGE